jgi:putative sterol carrier protein
MNLEELFVIMREKAEKVELKGPTSASIVLDITGDEPKIWRVDVCGTGVSVHEGEDPSGEPALRVITSDEVLLKVAERKLNPTAAFFTGKIKVKGDLALIGHLKNLWP